MTTRCRIAPSPTGPLHIGTARTALFNYLFARHTGGTFVLRLEDTDQARSTPRVRAGHPRRSALAGHRVGRGSGRGRTTRSAATMDPIASRSEAIAMPRPSRRCWQRTRPTPASAPPRSARPTASPHPEVSGYSGRCAGLSESERAARRAEGRESVIRFRIGEGSVEFDDLVRGHVSIDTSQLGGDLVIARSDGSPLYHFVVVVDDIAMRISHVIRGEDHLSNTPKHVLLFRALGAEPPVFAHLPLILNTDRSKMSKRKSQTAVDAYREQGYIPEAIVNHLALLGWSSGDDEDIFSLADLEARFDLSRVQPSGAIFDAERLDWLNGQWIRRLPPDDLVERALPFLERAVHSAAEDGYAVRQPTAADRRPAAAHGRRAPAAPRRHRLDARLRLHRGPRDRPRAAGAQALGCRHHRARPGRRAAASSRRPVRMASTAEELEPALRAALRAARLEGGRPLHGHPRRHHRPHRDAAAVRCHGRPGLRDHPGPAGLRHASWPPASPERSS